MVVEPSKTPALYTSYPVTATLSVAAVQDKLVVVCVVPEADNVGAVGAVVSNAAKVVTVTELLATDKLPAASFAFTVKAKVVAAVKPVTA